MSLVGSLEDLGLGDILQIVSLSRKSGVLNLSRGEVKGKIIFKDGQVVSAINSAWKKSVAELLAEKGDISDDKIPSIDGEIKKVKDAEEARKLLVDKFSVNGDKFENVVRDWIEGVVFEFFTWPEGNFSFELQDIEPEIKSLEDPDHAMVLEVGLSPQFLAMEGTRLQDERKRGQAGPSVGPPRASHKADAAPPPEDDEEDLDIVDSSELVSSREAAKEEEPADEEKPPVEEDEQDFSSVADAVAFYEKKKSEESGEVTPTEETPKEEEVDEVSASEPEPTPEEAPPEPEEEEKPEPSPEPAAAEEPTGGHPLIIADDDEMTLKSLAHHFEPMGYKVETFKAVGPAITRVQELVDTGDRPFAVIADLLMPNRDGSSTLGGLELLEETKQANPATPVVMITDYENQPAREKSEKLGVKYFFMKPKSSQLDEDFGSPELINFVQVLGSALESMPPPGMPVEDETPAAGEEGRAGEDSGGGMINLGEELRREFGEDVSPTGDEDSDEVVPSRGLHMLKAMISELNDPASNGQITLMILRFAAELMNRAVIFLVAKNKLAGLGQFGINLDGIDAQKHVRQMRIPLNEPSIFREAIQKRMPLKKTLKLNKWNEYLINHLGGTAPTEVFVAPIIAGGKIPAILYGDNVPDNEEIGDTESLEIFLAQAGLAMEKALLERRLKEIDHNGE